MEGVGLDEYISEKFDYNESAIRFFDKISTFLICFDKISTSFIFLTKSVLFIFLTKSVCGLLGWPSHAAGS